MVRRGNQCRPKLRLKPVERGLLCDRVFSSTEHLADPHLVISSVALGPQDVVGRGGFPGQGFDQHSNRFRLVGHIGRHNLDGPVVDSLHEVTIE